MYKTISYGVGIIAIFCSFVYSQNAYENILHVQTSQSSAKLRQFLTARNHDALYSRSA